MKTLIAVAALAVAPLALAGEPLKVGDQAPAFSLPSSQGKTVSLSATPEADPVVAFFPKAFTGGATRNDLLRRAVQQLHHEGANVVAST